MSNKKFFIEANPLGHGSEEEKEEFMMSVCIPVYNRTILVLESFKNIHDHALINEIIIVDDCSEISKFKELEKLLNNLNSSKIKLFRN